MLEKGVNMKKQEQLTVADVAEKLNVSSQYVRKIITDKKIVATRVEGQWVIESSALDDYLQLNGIIIEPRDHERLSDDLPEIVALSFFSGAMGLDIGMRNGGISPLLACEFNKYCRMTIAKNEPDIALIGDINKYEPHEILRLAKIPQNRNVDVIYGGPPCQAFSTAGARRALDDERGNVFLRYIDVIKEIRPTYVVIENVRGLLSAPYPYKESEKPIKGGALCVILDRLKEAGYTISFELYNAANFGTPQIRERVVIIGKLGKKKVPYLFPTHSEHGDYGLPEWRTLRDAFTQIHTKEHHNILFPEKRLKYYRMLSEGQYWKDLPPEVQLEAMGSKLQLGGGKTGFFRRLSFSKPSPTLVTNPTMPATDLCHPTEDRPLSVEEYMSIQEFPEDWVVCGSILERYKQIGNAVPIKLGEAIARTIRADMSNEFFTPYEGYKYSRYRDTNDVSWGIAMEKIIKRTNEREQMELFNV